MDNGFGSGIEGCSQHVHDCVSSFSCLTVTVTPKVSCLIKLELCLKVCWAESKTEKPVTNKRFAEKMTSHFLLRNCWRLHSSAWLSAGLLRNYWMPFNVWKRPKKEAIWEKCDVKSWTRASRSTTCAKSILRSQWLQSVPIIMRRRRKSDYSLMQVPQLTQQVVSNGHLIEIIFLRSSMNAFLCLFFFGLESKNNNGIFF